MAHVASHGLSACACSVGKQRDRRALAGVTTILAWLSDRNLRLAVSPCRYGNVSSASIWYVLAYLESFNGMRRGDRIWQMGFGSGFKCNSAVWRANRNFKVRGADVLVAGGGHCSCCGIPHMRH